MEPDTKEAGAQVVEVRTTARDGSEHTTLVYVFALGDAKAPKETYSLGTCGDPPSNRKESASG